MSNFRNYAERVLNEERVSSKLIKNTIDLLHDYIQYVKADLSKDERKDVIDNLEVTVDSISGESVSLTGSGEFIKDGKYNKKAMFSVTLNYDGVQGADDSDDNESTIDMNADEEGDVPDDIEDLEDEVPEDDSEEK